MGEICHTITIYYDTIVVEDDVEPILTIEEDVGE
jgi:hypothetical protein